MDGKLSGWIDLINDSRIVKRVGTVYLPTTMRIIAEKIVYWLKNVTPVNERGSHLLNFQPTFREILKFYYEYFYTITVGIILKERFPSVCRDRAKVAVVLIFINLW